jgi:predicted RNA-binding protein (virulence factor B family)
MILPGRYYNLEILKETPQGLYLVHPEDTLEILLPNRYVPKDWEVGQMLNVFLSEDGEHRLVATTETPKIQLDQFAFLDIVDVNSKIGAFADWGLPKHLLIPFNEQPVKMEKGKRYCIFLDIDPETNRLYGSGKYEEFLDNEKLTVEPNEEVEILILRETDLGFQCAINHLHMGLLYRNTIKKNIQIGETHKAWVAKIREDNKIDLVIQKPGFGHVREAEQVILEALETEGGFLPLHDKSDPQMIEFRLEMSKKTFKKAIGILYKLKKIKIEKDGISLI